MKEWTPRGNTGPKVECAHLMLWWCVTAFGDSQEESVKKRGRGCDTQPFLLSGEVTRAEWHNSFSLDEIYKFETPTAKWFPH